MGEAIQFLLYSTLYRHAARSCSIYSNISVDSAITLRFTQNDEECYNVTLHEVAGSSFKLDSATSLCFVQNDGGVK